MSIRGKRSYSRIRRPVAPPPSAHGQAARESGGPPEADADRLIAAFGLGAYAEARRRQRQARASEAAAHWAHVASLIARRTGGGSEPSTRAELAAGLASGGENSPAPWPIRFFETDPLDELERVLAVKPQFFRLQFFGAGPDLGPVILGETEIEAPDASSAIRAATQATWPARAVGLRVLDLEGREIFERLKADI